MSRRQHIGNYMGDDEEQAYSPPPTPRDPVHVTAAYLVAYLGTFPKEKKVHLSGASSFVIEIPA
jgi:hypothetical protein